MHNQVSCNSFRVANLTRENQAVRPDVSVREVQEMLGNGSPLGCVPVVRERRPSGLVMRCHLDRVLGTEFGRALYLHRPVSAVMDTAPLVVDSEATIEQVSTRAMQRDDTHLYDDVIVTSEGLLLGTVSVQDLLTHLAQAQGVLQVAGGTAHELNQPLQVVLGHSEILARSFREDFHEDDVQAILGGVTRMAQITKRLQNLTHYRTAPYLAGCAIVDLSPDTQ